MLHIHVDTLLHLKKSKEINGLVIYELRAGNIMFHIKKFPDVLGNEIYKINVQYVCVFLTAPGNISHCAVAETKVSTTAWNSNAFIYSWL